MVAAIALLFCAGGLTLAFSLGGLWWGAVFVDVFYCCQGRCPRCGRHFHSYGSRGTVRCRHCGLPFGTLKCDALASMNDA
jgi:hypothetical protein